MIAKLPPDQRARVDTMLVDEGPLSGFESRPVQERVIAEVVQWTAGRLGLDGAGQVASRESLGATNR